MNERNLNCFIKVYQLGSLHRAAQDLYLSVQAVSRIIGKLEEELGETLFIRSTSGLFPTPAADKLKEHAEIILDQYGKIKQDLRHDEDEEVSTLRIASTYAVLKYLSVDFIKSFYKEYPNIRLNFVEYPEYPIYEMLKKGQLNVAFLPLPIDVKLFDMVYCFSHHYCAVMNKKHPLASKKVLEYKDLNGVPLALKGHEYSIFSGNINRFIKGGLTPNILLETSDDSIIMDAAKKDWCVGITADYLAKEYADDQVAIIPFSDETYARTIFLAWKKGQKLSQKEKQFINYVLKWLGQNNEIN
ncbi:MAG: LysR family transcriptional regulator [Cellulosilyticum sp.]|nr:LysR family transcriptional regulator [Cellulosilyticum sp.]